MEYISDECWNMIYRLVVAGKVYCRECGKYISGPKYARHVRDVHTSNNEVECNMCSKVFKNQNSYKYHLRNSHGIYQSK